MTACACNFEMEAPCDEHKEAYDLYRLWRDSSISEALWSVTPLPNR